MATGITTVKRFDYRGETEEFSNTYWISRVTPTDHATWVTVVTGLFTEEKKIYGPEVEFVNAYCYDDDGDERHAVDNVVFADAGITPRVGTLSLTGLEPCPGDAAAVLRWKTTRVTSKGKPIYLRKFIHPAYRAATPTDPDALGAGQKTAIQAFGDWLLESGAAPYNIVGRGHHGDDNPTVAKAMDWVTTRTLKRRPKRPSP